MMKTFIGILLDGVGDIVQPKCEVRVMRFLNRPRNKGKGIIFSNYRAGDLLLLGGVSPSDKLDEIEIRNCALRLEKDEQCFYQGAGVIIESHEEIIGHDYSSRGQSYHFGSRLHLFRGISFGRGVSTRSSKGTSRVKKQTVTNEYHGTLYITNERFVFLCEDSDYSFDISLDDLNNVVMEDESVTLYSGTDTF